MPAYLDANLYISYLLKTNSSAPPATIVRSGFAGRFTIVYSDSTLREVLERAFSKPFLAEHVRHEDVDDFTALLSAAGERVHERHGPIPEIVRDRKDDYLIVNAALAQADFLVSGDKDLLEIGEIEGVRIVSPAEFVRILDGD